MRCPVISTLFPYTTLFRSSSQTNVGCFGGSTGSVTVAGSGGTSPYTYSIDGTTFGNSGTFSNLAAGSYTITVKEDRKSTRLNSSHTVNSYAVFCSKKRSKT